MNSENINDEEIRKQLQAPFEEQDIRWRVQAAGITQENSPWARVVPYITNRAIQKRLDDVLGLWGWEDAFQQTEPTFTTVKGKQQAVYGWLCGITIHGKKRSVTKWDGAEETDIEPFKGGLSGSEKRTGSKIGIGRYLYQLKPVWAICVIAPSLRGCSDNGHTVKGRGSNPDRYINWETPPIPEWALPGAKFEEFLKPIEEAETIKDLRTVFEIAYKQAESSGNNDNTQKAIDAKDKRKAEIEKTIIEQRESNYKKVELWLKQQTDTFALVPNESAVKTIYPTINESLLDKCKTLNLDSELLLKSLKHSYNVRIKELQPKKDAKQ